MESPTCEHTLPLPVRTELRALSDDLTAGAISPAEYDELVNDLLEALRIPLVEADD